jgi:tetratricopeptide (TPR) repeat protein
MAAKRKKTNTSVRKKEIKTVETPQPAAPPELHKKGFMEKLVILIFVAAVLFLGFKIIDHYTAWGNTKLLIKRNLDRAEKDAIYKRYNEAISEYDTLIKRFGNNEKYSDEMKQARLSLAKTLKDGEQYIRAIELYGKLIDEYKDNNKDMYAWLKLELADSYSAILNSDEAIKIYTSVVDEFKGTDWAAEALFGIADAYMVKKDFKNAVKYYDIIINKYKKGFLSAEALTNKGKILEQQGKDREALKVYQEVVKDFPDIVTEYAKLRCAALTAKPAN